MTPYQLQKADREARRERAWVRRRDKLIAKLRRNISEVDKNIEMWRGEIAYRRDNHRRFRGDQVVHAERMLDAYERAKAAFNNPRWRFSLEPGPLDEIFRVRFVDEDEMLYLLSK